MLYILEGPDGSGKTTLANVMRRKAGWSYIHAGKHKATPEGVRQWFARILHAQTHNGNLICDRSLVVSDTIYDTILKKQKASLDDEELFAMCDFLHDLHNVGRIRYIACVGVSTELIQSEPDDDPKMERLIRKNYRQLCAAYNQLHQEMAFRWTHNIWWYMPDMGCEAEHFAESWCSRRGIGEKK